MQNAILFIGNGLVITGILVLAITLVPLCRLLGQLPTGSTRAQWRILAALVLFFITGYTVYATLNWDNGNNVIDLVVPAVFFFGAIFVFMVCSLSLNTAQDIIRIYTLQLESVTDPLMGIFNRRYLERRLKEEGLRSQRYSQPLSILLLDVDYFKGINDTYGHQSGDLVLEKLGQLMLNSVRESDIVARYGGDEILVILPNTIDSEAFLFAERLRRIVERFEIELPNKSGERPLLISITVSIGVAGFNQSTIDLVETVDKALYQAKDEGRNMVILGNEVFAPAT
ncbi:MAG: GGDEF domain-containing protein [Desulfocapsa sp.]|nr:GGDEF domain-containing protein [Desulfocapsa sp.]